MSSSQHLLKESATQRRTMIDCQIRTFDVTDQRVIGRFLEVPRELFLPRNLQALSYSDIGFVIPSEGPGREARYLLPPLILARMIQGGRVKQTDRVLDVAAATGYSTAILAGLARSVVALEAEAALCGDLSARLADFGLSAIPVREGPLSDGAAGDAPFDVIFVNGAIQTNLDQLFGQLAEGGRLLVIKRDIEDPTGRASKAMCYEKRGDNVGARYLFDASAPCLQAFRETPQFVF